MGSKKQRKAVSGSRRRLGSSGEGSVQTHLLERNRVWALLLFAFFISAASFICFVGLAPAGTQFFKDQVARTSVVAGVPFNYVSEIESQRANEALRRKIPPVYRIDRQPFEQFKAYLADLLKILDKTEQSFPDLSLEDFWTTDRASLALNRHDSANSFGINPDDLALFARTLPHPQRQKLFQEAFGLFEDIFERGIFDPAASQLEGRGGSMNIFNIADLQGTIRQVTVNPIDQARLTLRLDLISLDFPRAATVSLFQILRLGLQSNLVFDDARTDELFTQALERLPERVISVREGQPIIEANTRVTARELEMLTAYREALRTFDGSSSWFNALLIERFFLTLAIALATSLYLKLRGGLLTNQLRTILLGSLLVLFNLGLNRLILMSGENVGVSENNPELLALLPWLTPVHFGPMLVTILMGGMPGVLAAGLVSTLTALMQGHSIATAVIFFLSAMTGIHFCRNIQVRARVVRAGLMAGLVFSVGAFFVGLRDNLELTIILTQMFSAAFAGVITGIVIVGLLPVLENVFKSTSDITLLELTDFNHPLLRQMQMKAPGSYHHSLMVANLSENAAAGIGANALLCRVCALYHDIGKMVKPEYFTENQREGINPHHERNPSMSALIIKAHVKEGVVLARQFKLPGVIIDVIKEHHGTSLIQYFYYKALQKQRSENAVESSSGSNPAFPTSGSVPRVELDEVNEDTYRYEGPRPHFKESAIIMLADSIEAASRSLRKVNHQSVDDLVSKIVNDRMQDGQLDDVDITLSEIARIKQSFIFSLLNMLHTRVEYPGAVTSPAALPPAEKTSPPLGAANESAATKPSSAAPQPGPGY